MPTKIKRFYKDSKNKKEKASFNQDFNHLEEFSEILYSQIGTVPPELKRSPIKEALHTRVELVLFQNKYRSYYLIEGIICELNNDNIPAVIPLVRSFWELVSQLGYIYWQLHTNEDSEYLLREPLKRIYLGNRNDGTGPFSIGNISSVNVLTMVEKTEKSFNLIQKELSEQEASIIKDDLDISCVYADLSNQSHPNYVSNMFYSGITSSGHVKKLGDVGQDMNSIKPLLYGFYMSPLMVGVSLYHLFLSRIYNEPRMLVDEDS